MATVSFGLNFQTQQAQQQLARLHQRGTSLFSKPLDINVNGKQLTGFNRSLDQATSRILAFTATTTLLYQTANALKRLTSEAIQVETAITGIQAILGATGGDLQKVTSELFKTANKTGVSFFAAADAAQEFSRAGFSLEKTLQATAAALGIVRTSGGNAQEVIQGLTSTISAFEGSNLSFQEIADKLSALDAAFATSASGIIQAFSRVASFASEAGVSIDQLGGLIATVKQISGRSEAQIGNSLKSIFVNLQNEGVQSAIEAVGIATKDANGEFRSAIDVLKDLSGVYGTLTDAQQAFLTQKVAGKFQANAFKSVISGIRGGTFDRSVGVSQGADDNIAKRLELLNETTATTIQRIENSITELSSTLGDAVGKNFVEGLLRYGNLGLDALKGIFERGNPVGSGIAAGLSAALTGPGIVIGITLIYSLFRKVSVELIKASKTLLQESGIIGGQTNQLKQQLSLQQKINQTLAARTHFTGPGGIPTLIRPTGPLSRPVRPDFTTIAQRANAQANFGQTPSLTLAAARKKYRDDINAYRSQQANLRRETARNQIIARSQVEKQLKAERRSSFIQKGIIGGAFLVPAITSAIAAQMEEGSGRRKVDAVGQGIGTALIGSMFGPIGAAAGILTGAFQILSTYTKELYGNIEDINRVAREQIAQNNKEQQSGDLFIQSLQRYNDAIKDGSPDLIRRARGELVSSGRSLTGDRRSLITSSRNTDELIRKNDKFAEQTDRLNSAAEARAAAEKLSVDAYKGLSDQFGGLFGDKLNISNVDTKPIVNSIVKSFDFSNINFDSLQNIFDEFGQTGNSAALQEFIGGLTNGNKNLRDSFDRTAESFVNGREGLAVSTAEQILETQKYTNLLKILTKTTSDVNFNKVFQDQIRSVFTGADFKDKVNQINRGFEARKFAAGIDGVGGVAGVKGQIASQLFEAQNNFINETTDAKGSFREQLQEQIQKGIQGAGNRGKLLSILENTLGDAFNPNTIKEVFASQIGTDVVEQLFIPLEPALEKFNNAVKISTATLDLNAKQITQIGNDLLRKSKGGFGDPRTNQSDEISRIIKGQSQILKGFNEKPGDSKLKFGQIFSRKTQTAKDILDTLEAEGQLSIFPQNEATRKGASRGAFRQLFDARRVEVDQGFVGNALDALIKGKTGSPKFEFGSGTLSASGYRKSLNENIQKGDFKAINENPVTTAIKAAVSSGDALAKSFLEALYAAQDRFSNINSASEVASDKFLKDNNLLENISTASQQTAANTKRIADGMSVSTATGVDTGLNGDQKAKVFALAGEREKLLKNQSELQRVRNELSDKRLAFEEAGKSNAQSFLSFNSGLDSFLVKGLRGLIDNESPQAARYREDSSKIQNSNDRRIALDAPDYFGKSILSSELEDIKKVGREIVQSRLNDQGAQQLINERFGEKRGTELFRGGVFDPLKSIQNKSYNQNEEKTINRELETIKGKLYELGVAQAVAQAGNPTDATRLEKGIQALTTLTESITQGLNIAFNAQIGVDVNGTPVAGFKDGLEERIRKAFMDLWKETTGKQPVVAPQTP